MNPIARIALVAAIAIFAVGGALYLVRPPIGPGGQPTPSPSLPPPSIEGTWETTFTRAEMLAAGIADSAEDNNENYGHFTLSIHAGTVVTQHLAPTTCCTSTATYVVSGNTYTVTTAAHEVFSWPFSVTATTLTFGGTGPVTLRAKPWTRIGP